MNKKNKKKSLANCIESTQNYSNAYTRNGNELFQRGPSIAVTSL